MYPNVINPYTGCVLGCAYCFASFAGRQFGRSVKEWGDYLYVKKNAVELARGNRFSGPGVRQAVTPDSGSGTAMAHVPMASRTSRSPSPRGVSAYSTRGGPRRSCG